MLALLCFTLALVAGSLAVCAGLRRLLRHRFNSETGDYASSVIFRISSLHALILALVFAQEFLVYGDLKHSVVSETSALADVYFDLARYGEETRPARASVAAYAEEVHEREWDMLRDDRLSEAAWAYWDDVYIFTLDLVPETPRETALRQRLLEDLDLISSLRDVREAASVSSVTPFFWLIVVSGYLFIIIAYSAFPLTPVHAGFLSLYAAYVGLIAYTIAGMNQPFAEPQMTSPDRFETLVTEDFSDTAGEAPIAERR